MRQPRLTRLELPPEVLATLPLCFHRVYTQVVYGAPEKASMEVASRRYDSVEILTITSEKPISKILMGHDPNAP